MTHDVPEALHEKSLAGAVKTLFELSWQKARDCIETGKVRVDGALIRDPRAEVRKGNAIVLDMNARKPIDESFVVFADRDIVVVNKPAGIPTVPWKDDAGETMHDRVKNFLQKKFKTRDIGVVHRLDKDTSGLIVFARGLQAKRALEKQFHAHTVHRLYLAICEGEAEDKTIKTKLVRDRGDGKRGSDERGTDSITHVHVREKLRNATLAECRIETGRTHQIRIQLSEDGHPILGDPVYAVPHIRSRAPRLMLHAAELGIAHPNTGAPMQWKIDPPADFAAVLNKLRH